MNNLSKQLISFNLYIFVTAKGVLSLILMTSLDYRDIQSLHFVHRFIPSAIARLYGVSHVVILRILDKKTFSLTDTQCLICGLEEEIFPFYIDGNEDNTSPQNVLMLCENHKRKFSHLKSRREIRFRA